MSYRISESKVPYILFPSFEKLGITHGFSTKLGGVSKGDCESMNLSFARGDKDEDVRMNHKLFSEAVGYCCDDLVFSDQVHGVEIKKVTKIDCGKGIGKESDIVNVDGLVTNEVGVPLITFYADCVPLFFADMKKKVVGMAHSGWRGTVDRIGANMVSVMVNDYGSNLDDIHVVIGPSICGDCYQVGNEVADIFRNEFKKEQRHIIIEEIESGQPHIDLWKANEVVLTESGIALENIEIAGLCTCCHHDIMFSHRYTKGRRGNLAGVITL